MTTDQNGVKKMANENYVQPVKNDFNTTGGQILLYYIDHELFGIEIQYITEIIGMQPITVVPNVPSFIKGVINIRGQVVPVISIRHKINRPEIPYDDKTCIIVVELEDLTAVDDHIAKSFPAADKFSDDHAHQTEPDIDLHGADDRRNAAWDHDFGEGVEPVPVEGVDPVSYTHLTLPTTERV